VPNDNPFLLPLPDLMNEAEGGLQVTVPPTSTLTIPSVLAPVTTQTPGAAIATPTPTATATPAR
jgi:hypothetical protein